MPQQNTLMQIFGRQAVSEALASSRVTVLEVLIAHEAIGPAIDQLVSGAERAGIATRRVSARRLDQLAGDDRRHQGVLAELVDPEPMGVEAFCATRTGRDWPTQVLLLDHVHNPANVGMILRTATAAGIDAVVLPRQGTASLGPLVVKAASGVVFGIDIVDAASTAEALDELSANGFEIVSLDAGGVSLYEAEPGDRSVWVLGNETTGISAAAQERSQRVVSLPLANGVESLNVAAAAAVVAYELTRPKPGAG